MHIYVCCIVHTSLNVHVFFYSKFLYDLTRSDGSSPSDSIVQRWMEAIAHKIGVTLRYTSHLKTTLVVRANHLRCRVRGFKGSAKKQRFLQQNWKLCLTEEDVAMRAMENVITTLKDELCELHHEVAHAAEDMKNLQREVRDLHEKDKAQEHTIADLKAENNRIQHRVRELSSLEHASVMTRGKSYKPPDEYSESHLRRLKRRRTENCSRSLAWLEEQGYVPTKIDVVNVMTGGTETITLCTDNLKEVLGDMEDIGEDELDTVNMMLYIKDWHNISDSAYHELAKVCKQMPRQYKLRKRIATLNSLWSIRPTPHNTHGVQ